MIRVRTSTPIRQITEIYKAQRKLFAAVTQRMKISLSSKEITFDSPDVCDERTALEKNKKGQESCAKPSPFP